MTCDAVRQALANDGLLVLQDKRVRSVVGIMTGEALSGSWWSHKKAHEIFRCLDRLGDDPDVLTSRLIAGKVTFIHRRLWPPFLTLAMSGERWQTDGLSPAAYDLLATLSPRRSVRATGAAARELQMRMLAAAEEVHTESGRHALALQTWSSWARAHNARERVAPALAREQLEQAVVAIGAKVASLPWNR